MRYSAPYPQPAPPYAAVPTWTGPYLGINLGYQFGSSQFGLKPDGFVGGIQGGYNYQIGQFVIGGETDFQFSGAEDTFAPYKFSNPWFGTLRGLAILRHRTYLCGVAHRRYGATGDCPSAFQTQRGFCDAGCDFPCELPCLDGCLSGLDAASWCDCGSCDWPSRRRHDEREQYVHIPPRSGI